MNRLFAQINEYLFYELGVDGNEADISDKYPFELRIAGELHVDGRRVQAFEFAAGGEEFFAVSDGALDYYPKAGMSVDDLRLQLAGEAWLANGDPVNLETSVIEDDSVPSALERRGAIEGLVARHFRNEQGVKILEGLLLRRTGIYLALAESTPVPYTTLLSDAFEPHNVGFAEASA